MAKQIKSSGEYNRKDGTKVSYEFEYDAFDSLQDAISSVGEDEALKLIQRMTKVDANNTAREKAKVVNGDSTRKPMTEEAKAEAKAERAQNKKVLELLKAKGVNSVEELASLLG